MDKEYFKTKLAPVFQQYRKELIAAYLFGSTAKSEDTSTSDIDIAVLTFDHDKQKCTDLKFRLYADLCRSLARNDIDIVLLNHAGNLILKDEIVRCGIVLYSADNVARESFELEVQHRCMDFKTQRKYAMGV